MFAEFQIILHKVMYLFTSDQSGISLIKPTYYIYLVLFSIIYTTRS